MTFVLGDLLEYLSELKHDELMEEHELFTTLSSCGYMRYDKMNPKQYKKAEKIFVAALREAREDI